MQLMRMHLDNFKNKVQNYNGVVLKVEREHNSALDIGVVKECQMCRKKMY